MSVAASGWPNWRQDWLAIIEASSARLAAAINPAAVSNVVGNVRTRFKVNAIESPSLVARAIRLMTHNEFAEGYNLIKDMQANEFLTALCMIAEHEVMVKKLSEFTERHRAKQSESIAALLTREAHPTASSPPLPRPRVAPSALSQTPVAPQKAQVLIND